MEDSQIDLLEQRMVRIAKMAVWLQCAGILTVILLIYFKPIGYKQVGKNFSISAFLVSFIISRTYIYTGKKLEEFKTFSSEELEDRKREYFGKFFWTYFFWSTCSGFFCWL